MMYELYIALALVVAQILQDAALGFIDPPINDQILELFGIVVLLPEIVLIGVRLILHLVTARHSSHRLRDGLPSHSQVVVDAVEAQLVEISYHHSVHLKWNSKTMFT